MSISIYRQASNTINLTVQDELSDNSYSADFHFSDIPFNDSYNRFHSLTKFLSTFTTPNNYLQDSSGILFPGLLYASKNHLIFEKPPCYQNIFVIPEQLDNINYENNSQNIYRIPIPWQIYFVSFSEDYYTSSVSMFFMNNSLLNSDQDLYLPPITNFYLNSQLCRPLFDDMEDIEKYSKDIAGVMNSAYDWVWQSGSNLDLTACIVRYFQQFSEDKENTILDSNIVPESTPEYVKPFSTFSLGSYYTSSAYINRFFELWEKVPLSIVSSLRWPNPSKFSASYTEIQNYRDNCLNDYISHIRTSNQNSFPTDCCEDCVDFDSYEESYVNTEDCECDCHNNIELTSSQENDFYYWCGMLPYKSMTFNDCYRLFLSNSSISINKNNLIFKNHYSVLQSLQSQVLYLNT